MLETIHLRKKALKTKGVYALYLDYQVEGKRVRKYTKLHWINGNKAHNNAVMEKIERLRQEIADSLRVGIFVNDETTLVQYARLYNNGFAEETIRSREKTVKTIIEFCKDVKLHDVNRQWMQRYVQFLKMRKNAANTINSRCAFIKTLMHRAFADGVICRPIDFSGLMPAAQRENACALTLDEVKKLIRTPLYRSDVSNAFLFSCFTGLRICDVRRLKYADMHDGVLEVVMQKTKKPIVIPLTPNALRFLPPKKTGESLVFPSLPKQSGHLNRILKRWAKDALIRKRVTFHTARRTFATITMEYSANIYTVSQLLGHSRLNTTLLYVNCALGEKRKAVESVPVIA